MTTEQKEMLLKLIEETADLRETEREDWNDIYWQIVKIDTDEF